MEYGNIPIMKPLPGACLMLLIGHPFLNYSSGHEHLFYEAFFKRKKGNFFLNGKPSQSEIYYKGQTVTPKVKSELEI